jgi:hypothetical protein
MIKIYKYHFFNKKSLQAVDIRRNKLLILATFLILAYYLENSPAVLSSTKHLLLIYKFWLAFAFFYFILLM